MKQTKQVFYAVARGYKTGIFTAWHGPDGCQAQTKGYRPNPIFRKIFTLQEAEEFLAHHGIVAPQIQQIPPPQTPPAQPAPGKAEIADTSQQTITRAQAAKPQRQQGEKRDHLAQTWSQKYNPASNWESADHTRDHDHANWSAPPSQSQSPFTDENQNQPHWGEGYLKNRMRDLKNLRINLPSPPAKEPVDRLNIDESIVSAEWCNAHDIPVPSELIDGEYQLAQEVYRRVLYSDTWTKKDKHMQQYFIVVDNKRDYNLNQTSDVTFQCLDRHAKQVRRIAHDSAQIRKSQEIEISLRSNYEDLEKINIRLCRQIEVGRERIRTLEAEAVTESVKPTPTRTGRRGSPARSERRETPARKARPTRKGTPTASVKRSSRKEISETTTIFSSPERVNDSPSPTTTESPTHYPEVTYESPGDDELELSNLNIEELSNKSESSNISSPTESLNSHNLDHLHDHHADLQYESECERLETLSQPNTTKSKSKSKKKITFDLTSTGNYSACEFCIQGFGKRTGHRGPHLTKRRTTGNKILSSSSSSYK
jgi:hypothetical protein